MPGGLVRADMMMSLMICRAADSGFECNQIAPEALDGYFAICEDKSVRLIGRDRIHAAITKHSNWKSPLTAWCSIVEGADWRHFVDVRQTYKSADAVGDCVVFNVKHNDCRVIASVAYKLRTVQVLHVLTHAEYGKDRWKNDCNC